MRRQIDSKFCTCTEGVTVDAAGIDTVINFPTKRVCGENVDTATIRSVIHLDVPYSPEAYLQETGRAGRDGRPVEATLLYSAEDLGFVEILGRIRGSEVVDSLQSEIPGSVEDAVADPLACERFAQILGYALDSSRCRREQLLGFLDQEPVSCSGCDVCDGRVRHRAEGEEQILEAVARNHRRFTLREAAQLMRGAKSYEVVRRGPASYHGFGVLAGWQEEEIEEALETLRRSGAIKVLKRGFWRDRITSGAH